MVTLAGFKRIFVDEIEWDKDEQYILTPLNGELPNVLPSRICRLAHWNLERYSESCVRDLRFDEEWCSDVWFAERAGYKYVPFGWTSDNGSLRSIYDPAAVDFVDYEYDFAHLSYLSFRRSRIIGGLIDSGKTFAPNCWGEDRHRAIRGSRAILSVHQDEVAQTEPMRYALAAAYNEPLAAEYSHNFYPWTVESVEHNALEPGNHIYWLKHPEPINFRKEVLKACGC